MFSVSVSKLRHEISIIKACTQSTEVFRSFVFIPPEARILLPRAVTNYVDEFSQVVCSPAEWRIFDHCAALTRLYAVYERFVVELITEWLNSLPRIFPKYENLPGSLKKEHRDGVARLLPRLGSGRYEDLTESDLLRGLFYGVSGNEGYELRPEPFIIMEQNLRATALDQLLRKVGVADSWGWVSSHPEMKEFVTQFLGEEETVESQLKSFIDYRNEAAHGYPESVLGNETLAGMSDFVQKLCEILAEWMLFNATKHSLDAKLAMPVGTIQKHYRNNIVVARMQESQIAIGNQLVALGRHGCVFARIESLQVNDVPVDNIEVAAGLELGIRFDCTIPKNADLVRLQ
jgi:hypothetical protein